MVAVNRNEVFIFSFHSLHVSARTGHLQVNIIVSYEASYAFLTDPLLRLSTYLLLVIKQLLCFSKFVRSLEAYLKNPNKETQQDATPSPKRQIYVSPEDGPRGRNI
jgi:hypothetical protein